MFTSSIAARTVLLSVMVLGGCGGGNNGNPPPGPDPNLILVAGQYATAVRLEQNTCPGIVVQNNPTTVVHAAGASTVAITHAAITYDGTLRPSGAFETSSRAVTVGTETHTISVAGQFFRQGFDAHALVDVVRPDPPTTCQYDVRWTGTKQGAPNNIPGQ